MKNFKIISALLSLMFLIYAPCKSQTISEDNVVVLLIDKTTSAASNEFITKKYEKAIKKIMTSEIKKSGDKIYASYLFSNSASASNITEHVYSPPSLKKDGLNSMELKIEKIRIEKRQRRYKKQFKKRISDFVFKSQVNQGGSNIVGSLKQLATIISKHPNSNIHVYYLSDLQECSEFRKMYCMNAIPFTTYADAKKIAKEDVGRLNTKYQLSPKDLRGIKSIKVIFPANEMDGNEAFELVPVYWKALFKAYGITDISFN